MDSITTPPVIRLHEQDGVVIARAALPPGTPVGPNIVARGRVPAGHKVAVMGHAPGEAVRRYGQIIGFATHPIAPGEWVHTHNMAMGDFARDYAWGVDARATALAEVPEVFQGIRRADGPERVFGEWWRDAAETSAVRDYFVVEDGGGARFWLFRSGDGEDAATGNHRWYLHGFFG